MKRARTIAQAVFAILLVIIPTFTGQAFAQGDTWGTKADMLFYHYAGSAGVIDGKLYVVGGHDGVTDQGLEVYDPDTNMWTALASPPTAVRHAAAGVIGGRLYVAGGLYGTQLQVYNPLTDLWAYGAPMPNYRVAHAAAVIGGKLYVVGGGPAEVDVYDPGSDTWAVPAPTSLPTPRDWLGAVAINGKLYVAGGYAGSALDTLEVYDPAGNSWTTKTPMPIPRTGLAVGVIDGKLHVVGGWPTSGDPYPEHDMYDPDIDSWTTKAPMPTPRGALVAGVITEDNCRLYAAGGQATTGGVKTVEAYTPESCAAPPVEPVCGNGVVEAGEQCDDGNTLSGDGCSATCTIEVAANNAPVCTAAVASPSTIWSPNHKLVPISIVGVTDPDGDSLTITPTAVMQDEAVKVPGGGAGSTSPDATLSPLQVRAERNGNPKTPGNGRVYRIDFTADDGKGGTCNGTVTVCVPHDQRPGATCVDDGTVFNSLLP